MRITIAPGPASAAGVAARPPGRADLDGGDRAVLRRSRGPKADLLRVELGGARWMVKDFAGKPWWWRAFGRLVIARELRAYRHLDALDVVPRRAARIDGLGLAVEWVEGELLALAPNRVTDGHAHVARLREAIERIHARGVAHLDLRSNKNVVLAPDGRVVVVDFASAVCLRPGGLAHRWLFPLLAANDVSGWLKWKRTLEAGPLTADELMLVRRHRFVRRLWFVNPKRRRGAPGDAARRRG